MCRLFPPTFDGSRVSLEESQPANASRTSIHVRLVRQPRSNRSYQVSTQTTDKQNPNNNRQAPDDTFIDVDMGCQATKQAGPFRSLRRTWKSRATPPAPELDERADLYERDLQALDVRICSVGL